MDAETAAMELAQFANIMGMSHDQVRNFGSTIVDLGNHFATTEADISSMAMRIAGAGKQIGMSEADVLGLSTALSSMGINAEAGGTAISTIMSNIDKAVATNSDKLATWAETANMSVEECSQAWGENAVGALSAVLVGMESATEEGGNMSLMLEELGISSIRQTDTFKRLASNSEFLGRAVETANNAWRENTALDKEVENRNNSMAAQLQILWNKVQAVAVEVGEPLMKALIGIIDAADPLIDALASGAKAFADLDEGGQKAVITAIAIVAAIGPASAAVGKLITGISGSKKTWKEFADNLKTVKTNLIGSTAEINKQAAAQSKYKTIMVGGQQATVKYNAATKEMKVIQSATTTATKAQTVAMKASTTATKASVVAMNTAKVAAGALKTAFMTIAPVLAITAAIEAFSLLSNAMKDANEKAEQYKKATDGITGAMDSYNKAFNDTRASMENASEGAGAVVASLQEIRDAADDSISKTAELADSLSESFADVGTNNAMVQTYADTIKRLTDNYDENGNKAVLTAEQQGELINAVNGLNEIMGTSYDVIDAQNGILNTNTSEILASAAAWQKRALMEAQSAASADIMKRMVENTTALTKAEETLKSKQDELTKAGERGATNYAWYASEVENAQAEVDRLKGVQEGLEQEQKDLNNSVATLNNEINSSVEALKDYVKTTDGWSSALEDAGINAADFSKSLSDIGVSTEDLARIMAEKGEEGISGFIAAYQEGGDSLKTWMRDEMGQNLGDAARDASQSAGDGFLEGLSGSEQRILNALEGLVGISSDEFEKVATNAGISGEEAIGALAVALAEGTVTVESSAEDVQTAVQDKLDSIDGEYPARTAIYDMGKALDEGRSRVETAAKGDVTSANAGFNTIDGENPGKKGSSDFAAGIAANVSKALTSGKLNANEAKKGFQTNDDKAGTWGEHLTQAWARGISAASDFVSRAATGVANVVKGILGHSIPEDGPLREGGKGEAIWGEHLVQNIIDGMANKRPALRAATKELAQDMNDELMAELSGIDPMKQLTESIARGSAAVNMSAMMVGAAPSYTNNTQNVTFAGAVNSPDIIARELRMQQLYGLAGQWL